MRLYDIDDYNKDDLPPDGLYILIDGEYEGRINITKDKLVDIYNNVVSYPYYNMIFNQNVGGTANLENTLLPFPKKKNTLLGPLEIKIDSKD
jgi:hypothetical protein